MNGTPTVCIDCSPLLVRSAGVKTYLYHWVRALQQSSPNNIRTFLAPGRLNGLTHEGGLRMYPAQLLTLISLNMLPGFVSGMIAPRSDVFHVSNLLRRPPGSGRLSATLHDLTPWILPQCHTEGTVAAEKAFAARFTQRAAGVIADSESTKNDAVRILGISPERIRVIHLGIPNQYFSVSKQSASDAAEECNLRRPYFLFVSTIEPRKNVDTLLIAWESLDAVFRKEFDLVIVGMPGWRSEATMARISESMHRNSGIRYLGYVPESLVPGLTAGAVALVYPSLYEGFGLPAAQAMAAGCPVITSNVSSLPEITGNAALLIDPLSQQEIASAILKVGRSESLAARLRAAGLKQAARFTWEAAASASLKYFRDIAGS